MLLLIATDWLETLNIMQFSYSCMSQKTLIFSRFLYVALYLKVHSAHRRYAHLATRDIAAPQMISLISINFHYSLYLYFVSNTVFGNFPSDFLPLLS